MLADFYIPRLSSDMKMRVSREFYDKMLSSYPVMLSSYPNHRSSRTPRNSGSNRNSSPLGAIFVKYIIIIFCFFVFSSFFLSFFLVSLKFEKSQPFWGKNVSRFGGEMSAVLGKKCQPFWGENVSRFGKKSEKKCQPFWGVTKKTASLSF